MRLQELKETVANQVKDAADLVGLLELSIEDILDRFADRLLEHQEKFGVTDDGGDE